MENTTLPNLSRINSLIIGFFFFLGLHLWHMEAPRLVVASELQLPTYTTATAYAAYNAACGNAGLVTQ